MQDTSAYLKNLPVFSTLNLDGITQALENLLENSRYQIQTLLAEKPKQWEDLLPKLMLLDNKLHCFWSPIQHLQSVANNSQIRSIYQDCLPLLTEYFTEMAQNLELQQAFQSIFTSPTFDQLDTAQQQVIKNALRDFHLAGVDLPHSKKQRFREISTQLASLQNQFENNVLDATQHWKKYIIDAALLSGLPETALQVAQELAAKENFAGWILTLDFPCYFAVISHADNSELRQEIYHAYLTRASEIASHPDWDNSEVMLKILQLRHEQATLLGFSNYAEYSLATKMAKSSAEVIKFLENLLQHCKPFAKVDYITLTDFVKQHYLATKLNPWDIAYYSEKLRKYQYAISHEQLRPYFPIEQVLKGLFTVINKLYGITIKLITDVDVWHPDVSCYELYDATTLRGICYLDLYTRPNKRSGAWMDSFCQRFRFPDSTVQIPVAFITCNFTPPTKTQLALLTHDDVITLFHEFGHGLHHMLTTIDYAEVSGIAGVPWDAVELPSQFMENWCWQHVVFPLLSSHYKTGDPLPKTDFERLMSAKNFQAGMAMIRQIELALFDIRIHAERNHDTGHTIQAILDDVRQQTSVTPIVSYNRFQHSFTHIFSGGYAAGYYSYLWAEVLASDAFAKFEETGIFNPETGQEFLTNILQRGGSADMMALFVAFRGREPHIDALLRHSGFKGSD